MPRALEDVLSKISLAAAMKEAHERNRIESERMENLEFQFYQNHLNAAEAMSISQEVQNAGGEWIVAARRYYSLRPTDYSYPGMRAVVGP